MGLLGIIEEVSTMANMLALCLSGRDAPTRGTQVRLGEDMNLSCLNGRTSGLSRCLVHFRVHPGTLRKTMPIAHCS